MASGAFQESTEISNNMLTFKTKKFSLEKDQEYVFLERIGNLYNWSGDILEESKIYEVKVGGCVRISVGFQDLIFKKI